MDYELNGEKYILNLIDTPGHIDFTIEVHGMTRLMVDVCDARFSGGALHARA
jgi:translation elongation factor EF-G